MDDVEHAVERENVVVDVESGNVSLYEFGSDVGKDWYRGDGNFAMRNVNVIFILNIIFVFFLMFKTNIVVVWTINLYIPQSFQSFIIHNKLKVKLDLFLIFEIYYCTNISGL